MRYRLRTLLIVLAIGPPFLAIAWPRFTNWLAERNHHAAIDKIEKERLIAKLDQLTDIDVIDMPIKDIAAYLEVRHDVTIPMAEGSERKTPLTVRLQGASLRTALERLLPPLGLDYQVKKGSILIEPKRDRRP
jgi:hypothetical protein